MIQRIVSEQEANFIESVGHRLVEIFQKPLRDLSEEKNYFTHVGTLMEIFEWSWDFYDQYFDKVVDWDTFKKSKDNIFNSDNLGEFIVAFGHAKFLKFCFEHAGSLSYFTEKYKTLY